MAQAPDGTLWVSADGRSRYHCDRVLKGEVWELRPGSEGRALRFPDVQPPLGAAPGPTVPVQVALDGQGLPWVVVQAKSSCMSDDGRIGLLSARATGQVVELEP